MSIYSRGNHMILDGDMLGITPDMTQSEVIKRIKHPMNLHGCFFHMHTIQISIASQMYNLKCRKTGKCDFRRG